MMTVDYHTCYTCAAPTLICWIGILIKKRMWILTRWKKSFLLLSALRRRCPFFLTLRHPTTTYLYLYLLPWDDLFNNVRSQVIEVVAMCTQYYTATVSHSTRHQIIQIRPTHWHTHTHTSFRIPFDFFTQSSYIVVVLLFQVIIIIISQNEQWQCNPNSWNDWLVLSTLRTALICFHY